MGGRGDGGMAELLAPPAGPFREAGRVTLGREE